MPYKSLAQERYFNANRAKGKYAETVAAMDAFFVSLGWMQASAGGR